MVPLSGIVSLHFHPASSSPLVKSDKAYRDGRPLSESGGALHFTALLLRLRYFPQEKKMIFIFWEFQSLRWAEWKRGVCFVQRGRSPPRLIRKEGDCVPHLMKWERYLSGGWGGVCALSVRCLRNPLCVAAFAAEEKFEYRMQLCRNRSNVLFYACLFHILSFSSGASASIQFCLGTPTTGYVYCKLVSSYFHDPSSTLGHLQNTPLRLSWFQMPSLYWV